MTRVAFIVRRNRDGTATFRSGRYVEHIDTRDKGLYATYEALRMAALTSGLQLGQKTLEELLRIARGLEGK